MRQITSRDNPTLKALRALVADPREPRRQGRTVVDGIHLVTTCLTRGVSVEQLLVSESGQANAEIGQLLAGAAGIDTLILRDALFQEISGVATPTGIAAVISVPLAPTHRISGDAVVLDAVQDAGNVGAILRTAAAAGIQDVVLGAGCAGAWTPRVLRAGQGAHFGLCIREFVDLSDLLNDLAAQDIATIATVARSGENLFTMNLSGPVAWLFGNEGAGLSPALVTAAQRRAVIPLAANTESLNVAAAAAICFFEAVRQRRIVEA